MSHYKHLTIEERESLLFLLGKHYSIREIARQLSRSPSTISRELKRNHKRGKLVNYSPEMATKRYLRRRKNCHKHYVLENKELFETVKRLFVVEEWSPEEIANRLKYENYSIPISYRTIYRAIYKHQFDDNFKYGRKGAIIHLRRAGKKRKSHKEETRGKIKVTYSIDERPKEAEDRMVIGHMEADTILGRVGRSCIFTMVDRASRYLLGGKIAGKRSKEVKEEMIKIIESLPKDKIKTITPDRGKEFAEHEDVTLMTGIRCYFPPPHSPWARGTNENTNGLVRSYIPKRSNIDDYTIQEINTIFDKLNRRPRKCLGWKTPYEVFYEKVLHLV